MRAFTTGFFIVSRFLPRAKRDRVEVIYSTVRYPDEIVDNFPVEAGEQLSLLDAWAAAYETALEQDGVRAAMRAGVPAYLAGFAQVVREAHIPPEHYRSFLGAMRLDAEPRPFLTLDDLINDYIYGSAIVVGYFLTHVYGSRTAKELPEALASARALGIGLQLTNFLRDVGEDYRRGRWYLPLDRLRAEGLESPDVHDSEQRAALGRVVRGMAETAETYYREARSLLDAFAPDCRIAIRACIDVYGMLNERILKSDDVLGRRESVPLLEKLRPLPASKYWRIPAAYLTP
jgi:phytoene synthase